MRIGQPRRARPRGQADRPARQSVLPQSTVGVQSLTHLHATVGPTFERVQVDRGWPGTRPESLHPRTVAGSLSSRIRRHRGSPKRANSRRGTLCFLEPGSTWTVTPMSAGPLCEIRALRPQLQRSQTEFAAVLGVAAETYRTWDSGRRAAPGTGRGYQLVLRSNLSCRLWRSDGCRGARQREPCRSPSVPA